jgi:hypothetical protein
MGNLSRVPILIIYFLLIHQQNSYAFNLFTSNQKELLDEKDNINFEEHLELLQTGYIQIAIKAFNKNELLDTQHHRLDIDNINNKLQEQDLISIAKTAVLYTNTNINSFAISNISDDKYCKSWLQDDNRSMVDTETIISEKMFIFKKITTRIHLEDYNFTNSVGTLTEQKANTLLSLQNYSTKPELVTSTYSNENDISFGSHGARTINYYYNLEEDVLHISYKIFSLKKESEFDSFPLSSLGIWNRIKDNILTEQINGSLSSILAIKDYLNNQ